MKQATTAPDTLTSSALAKRPQAAPCRRAWGIGLMSLAFGLAFGTVQAVAAPPAPAAVCEWGVATARDASAPPRSGSARPGHAGPLRPALRDLQRGRYARAVQRLDELQRTVRRQVDQLFHAADDKTDSAGIRTFLDTYVYGPDAILRVVDDRFEFIPAYWSARLRCACERGDRDAAAEAVAALRDLGPSARLGELAAALRNGDAAAALGLAGAPRETDELAEIILRAWSFALTGDGAAMRAEQDRALRRCVGTAECKRARQAVEAIDAYAGTQKDAP